jgi:sulfur-oxidizing protein SoxB
MISRRHVVIGMGVAALGSAVPVGARGQDRYDQQHLLSFDAVGTATLIHVGELFGQTSPHFMRPAADRLVPEGSAHLPEYLTGELLRIRFGVGGRQPLDYALTAAHFEENAAAYGPMGGLRHLATVVAAIRAARPGALLLGGAGLGPLAPVPRSPAVRHFMVQGVPVGVVDTADLVALPMQVAQVRDAGAVVVCRSSRGIAGDRRIADQIAGIDLILSGGDAPAFVEPVVVGNTHLIASGSQGRFVTRIDLDMGDGVLRGIAHRLIPVFADLIDPTPVPGLTTGQDRVLGRATGTLYRRGALASTWDDLICRALRHGTGAQAALVPGVQHGVSLLPGAPVTQAAVDSVIWGLRPEVTLTRLNGAALRALLEDAAETALHPDPLQRGAGAMTRVGGVHFVLDTGAAAGQRIGALSREDGTALAPGDEIDVALWGRPGIGAVAGDVGTLIASYLRAHPTPE